MLRERPAYCKRGIYTWPLQSERTVKDRLHFCPVATTESTADDNGYNDTHCQQPSPRRHMSRKQNQPRIVCRAISTAQPQQQTGFAAPSDGVEFPRNCGRMISNLCRLGEPQANTDMDCFVPFARAGTPQLNVLRRRPVCRIPSIDDPMPKIFFATPWSVRFDGFYVPC